MADFNLQPIGLMGQSNIEAPGLGKLGDIMTGAQNFSNQLQVGFNTDTKRQFAAKVQQAIDGVPVYITDPKTGESVQNPAYVAALKPLALEAYHAQVQTGDNTLMDDLNTLIKTQQSASGRANIDWASAQAIEQAFNTFRTELEGLQERKTQLTADEKVTYEKLYNKYLGLDSQYNQITQGKRLPFKGRTDQYNANRGELEAAQTKVAQYNAAEAQDKAIQDVTDVIKENLSTWTATNKDKLRAMSLWQNFANAFKLIQAKGAGAIKDSPALIIGLIKSVNKMIEPEAAVMADDVNTMTGSSAGTSVIDKMVGLLSQVVSIIPGADKMNMDQIRSDLSSNKYTQDNIQKIINLGNTFMNLGVDADNLIAKSYDALGSSLLSLAQTRSANRLAMSKDANGQPLNVQSWASTPNGKGALRALISANIPAAQVTGEIENMLGDVNNTAKKTDIKNETPTAVPPSEYVRIHLPVPPDISGDFTTAKNKTIEWLNGALSAFNASTDSKLRMKQRNAIIKEYKAAEDEYDMPSDIDSAVKAIQVQEAPNPTITTGGAKTTTGGKSNKSTTGGKTSTGKSTELKSSKKGR